MEEKIKIHEKFAYSFYNFSAYKNFLTQGLFRAILYIFGVTLIFTTISNYSILKVFNDDYTRIEKQYNTYSPEFELKDSYLKVESTEPITYKYTGNSVLISLLFHDNIIVDTNDSSNSSMLNTYYSGVFVGSDGITVKELGTTIGNYKYSEFPGLEFDKDLFGATLSTLKYVLFVVILLLNPIAEFVLNLAAVFLFIGPISMIIAKNFKFRLSYKNACTLGLYSMTLPILLQTLSTITGFYVDSFNVLFYLLTLCYCTLAINTFVNTHKNSINDAV